MTDLRVKVKSHLRVKVCSPLGGHKRGNTGSASTSENGISRSSSRGRGRSWRGVVEVEAEMRLMIWGGGSMIREKRFKRQKGHRVVSKDKKWVKRK